MVYCVRSVVMAGITEYTVIYDINSQTQAIVVQDKVISVTRFKFCPYVWFGEMKDKIEAGKILWVEWNKTGVINA